MTETVEKPPIDERPCDFDLDEPLDDALPPDVDEPGDDDGGDDRDDGSEGNGGRRERWITIATFSVSHDAHIARIRLESQDIACVILDENTVSTMWHLGGALGWIKLQVPEPEVERARSLLDINTPLWAGNDAACHACASRRVEVLPRLWSEIILSMLLLGFPLPFASRRWRCASCGKTWQGPAGTRGAFEVITKPPESRDGPGEDRQNI